MTVTLDETIKWAKQFVATPVKMEGPEPELSPEVRTKIVNIILQSGPSWEKWNGKRPDSPQ